MAGRVSERDLGSRTKREALPVSGKPYFRELIPEKLHLGYRRGARKGVWVARRYVGDKAYEVASLGVADDFARAADDAREATEALTYDQAMQAAIALYWERTGGKAEPVGPYTVADAIRDYVTFLDHEGKSTRDANDRARTHILPALGTVEVAKLTAKQLRGWQSAMAKSAPRKRVRPGAEPAYRDHADDDESRRRRKASANRTMTVLKAALNFAWRDNKATDDKAWRSVEPFKQANSARVRYLQIDEATRLINACEPGFRKLARAALETGCRYSELCRLRVEDFNADAGTITIRRAKGEKPRHVILTAEGAAFFATITAGRAGRSVMLVNEERLARAAERTEAERRRQLERGDRSTIVDGDTGEWRPSEQVREMAAVSARAKLDPPANFHALRHTWASHAVMNGTPLMVVARNLGHADTRMTETHYGHLAPSFVADAIRAGAPRFGVVEPSNVSRLGVA